MRMNLFESGLIDEIAAENVNVLIIKTGHAKFSFKILGKDEIEFDLWTTKNGSVKFEFLSDTRPEWVSLDIAEDQLMQLKTESCWFHLEHCDRGLYFVEMSKDKESFGGNISTNGYIKTKLVGKN